MEEDAEVVQRAAKNGAELQRGVTEDFNKLIQRERDITFLDKLEQKSTLKKGQTLY